MRVLLAGGGTAGHINPAIAIADKIKEKNSKAEIIFVGNPEGMEARLVKNAKYKFEPIEAKGFYRSLSPSAIAHNISAVKNILTSTKKAKQLIKQFQPDVAIGTGGYVSGTVIRTASKMGIKTAIHEQNAYPGVTNKILSRCVDVVFSATKEAEQHLDVKGEFHVTGNPVRQQIYMMSKSEARAKLGLDDKFCILSFGGSLGADTINKIAFDLIEWHCEIGDINHIHGYGRLGKEKFPNAIKEANINLDDFPRINAREYIDDMELCLSASDLVVCRAGALSISELQATNKCAILVPSPNVTANHQYHNAMVLQNNDAGIVIQEKDYSKELVIKTVEELYNDREKLKQISNNCGRLAKLDTTDVIYENILKLIQQTSKDK